MIALLIGSFGIRLAVEDHLLPSFKAFEHVEHLFKHRVMTLRWVHKSAVLQTVVLEQALVLWCHAEGLQAAFVLELETGFGCAVLDEAEDLDEKVWVVDHTAITADGLTADVSSAVLALVLDFDELDVSDEAQDFDHMPDDLVSWDRFDQLDRVVGLEVSHLVLDSSNDFEIRGAEHQLHVDVDSV